MPRVRRADGVYEPSVVIHDARAEHPGQQPSAHQPEDSEARYHLDCRFRVKVGNERRRAA